MQAYNYWAGQAAVRRFDAPYAKMQASLKKMGDVFAKVRQNEIAALGGTFPPELATAAPIAPTAEVSCLHAACVLHACCECAACALHVR